MKGGLKRFKRVDSQALPPTAGQPRRRGQPKRNQETQKGAHRVEREALRGAPEGPQVRVLRKRARQGAPKAAGVRPPAQARERVKSQNQEN